MLASFQHIELVPGILSYNLDDSVSLRLAEACTVYQAEIYNNQFNAVRIPIYVN